MSHELETAAADAAGGFFRRRPEAEDLAPVGSPCANCATPLMGPWCYACGQLGEDFHRSIWKLLLEAVEGVIHFDGRVWRTVPDLFRDPAKLTRDYLEGHRAPQVPPFRLFLVVLLAIFVFGALGGRGGVGAATTIDTDATGRVHVETHTLEQLTPAERTRTEQAVDQAMGQAASQMSGPGLGAFSWLRARLDKVLSDPDRFEMTLERWSERFAFLTLPMSAALLSLAFLGDRRFFVFDHTIFSLHSLSAVGLMYAAATGLQALTGGFSAVILAAAPVHLFVHMRGVYRTSVVGTLARMAFLFVLSALGGVFILTGLIAVGLFGMGA